MDAASVIPVIDLRDPDVNSLARQIGDACQSVGFFAVVNHGVDDALIDRAFAASRAYFDLPDEAKLLCKTTNEAEYPYGYERSENLNRGKRSRSRNGAILDGNTGGSNDEVDENANSSLTTSVSETESLKDADDASAQQQSPRADLKETFSIGPCNPDAGMPPRRFPSNPPDLQGALELYYEQMERLASRLLGLFAVALDLPSQDWFEQLLTRHLSALRILNYYEFDWPTPSEKGGQSSERVLIRAGEHTDYGALTILRSGGPGLQLRKDGPSTERGDGASSAEWVNVPEIPGAFIINIGDMMQRWTNDKWVSTLHRVVVDPWWFPRGADGIHVPRRQSMAYFCQVNGDATITPMESCGHPPKYPPITAREHVMHKHLASMGVL